jgi:hypothetical protein
MAKELLLIATTVGEGVKVSSGRAKRSGRVSSFVGCSALPMDSELETEEAKPTTGVANAAVIDLFALDQKTDQVLLVMKEQRPWDGSDERLHQLQEKFNAYVSFLLDGEMLSAHPELAGKRSRIELHCLGVPDERALELLHLIHEQLALQEIGMEVVVAETEGCGSGCTCH